MIDLNQAVLGIIAASGLIIGAILTYLSNRGNKATQTLDMALKELNKRVSDQDTKIEELKARLDEKEAQINKQDTRIRELQDRERDREELIQDFLEGHVAVEQWFNEGGYTPPLPRQSWRVRQAVAHYKAEQRKEVGS